MALAPLAAALLVVLPSLAKEKYKPPEGEPAAPEAKDHQQRWTDDPTLPKDQGWKAIGLTPDGKLLPQLAPDPAPKLDEEELVLNLTTVLETHLAPTDGRWVYEEKGGRERRLALDAVTAVAPAGGDRYRARARFKDKHGLVAAEALVQLGDKRWRVLELGPVPARRKR